MALHDVHHLLQENDQRKLLEKKREEREEAKKAAKEARLKKRAAQAVSGGRVQSDYEEVDYESEPEEEHKSVIDDLLTEIKAGMFHRRLRA